MDEQNLFKNVVESKSEEEREKLIAELASKMSLGEKIRQMSGDTDWVRQIVMIGRYNQFTFDSGENRRLGIPAIKFTDGPHGISLNRSTCFPVSSARGATWDVELEERVGEAMGIEARSQDANFFGGVCINATRHPAGGRSQESFGEDPHHLGAMAAGMIKGLQRHVMACAKHFACNSIENSRFFVDVRVDDRTLREIYLPHFRKCVESGVAAFMSAYNRLNGEYCGHNGPLLNGILKGDWKFDGFVMSDFMLGVRDGKAGANGGLDMEMPFTWRYGRKLKKLVTEGQVSEKTIDEAVTRILRQKARFYNVGEPSKYGPEKVACREHTELALEVARKSIVLLKNENRALPIARDKVKTVAVIGELACVKNLGDMGSSRVRPPWAVTALEGIRNRAGDSVKVLYSDAEDFEEAKRVAHEADAAVVFAGLSGRDEGEYIPVLPPLVAIGGDRNNLGLSEEHEELIKAVAKVSERCVVVLEGGSAITVDPWINDVEALLMAWYPGMEGGNAIADILFGDVNPSAKLPVVFHKSADQLPPFDNKAKSVDYGYYHGYRLFDKKEMEPRFHFGFGMSYTTYRYSDMKIENKRVTKDGSVKVSVNVSNTGEMRGEEIVQLYVGCKKSAVDRPVRELKAFKKVAINAGESVNVSLEVKAADLAWYDASKKAWAVEEGEYTASVGPSSRKEDLKTDTFEIAG